MNRIITFTEALTLARVTIIFLSGVSGISILAGVGSTYDTVMVVWGGWLLAAILSVDHVLDYFAFRSFHRVRTVEDHVANCRSCQRLESDIESAWRMGDD